MSIKKCWIIGISISLIISLAIGYEITKFSELYKGLVAALIFTIPVSCFWALLIYSISNKMYKDKAFKHRLPMSIFALITTYTLPFSLIDALWNINMLSDLARNVLFVLGILSSIGLCCIPLLTCRNSNEDKDAFENYQKTMNKLCDECSYTDCPFRNKRALLKEQRIDHRKLRCQKEADEYMDKMLNDSDNSV